MNKLKWDRDFAMEQAADDAELLRELINIFKESSGNDYRSIENGVTSKDAEMVCAAAHSIKGAAASLGIEGLREIALAIENDSRQGSLATAQSRIVELREILQELQQL
jgi:HPt (histidine-containing phosphotransfer) domain-containing protein